MAFPREYISHNQIRTYLECPYKYYLAYIREIKTACNEKVFLGNIFHSTIEKYFKAKLEQRVLQLSELVEIFQNCFEEEKERNEIIWTESIEQTRERGIAFVKHFHHKIGPEIRPLMIEKELEVDLPDTSIRLKGILDLVEEDFTITDFKTSTTRWSENKARSSLQFAIYKYLFEKSFAASSPRIRVEQLYNNGTKKTTRHRSIIFSISDQQINQLLEKIHLIINLINEENFIPNFSYSCRWCDFREHCQQK